MEQIKDFFEHKTADIGYVVFLPKNYEKGKKYPLVTFLHGAGERGDGSEAMLERVFKHGLAKYANEGAEYPFVLLCPQCPEDIVWNNVVFALKALIDSVASEYGADENRIYCTGASMGGFGTWEMGLTYPDFFAAIAPICGGGLSWRALALTKMPIRAFHGDADSIVPIEHSYLMVDSINKKGGNARLTVFHGVNHNSWDPAYLETRVLEWLLEQNKENWHDGKRTKDF